MPPPTDQPSPTKTLEEIVEEVGVYSADAFEFVQEGLSFTAQQIHGEKCQQKGGRHISGQELCEGLRNYAVARWGRLAGVVLRRWGITTTMDFGRIVFALIANGIFQKTEEDSLEDFRNVFDLKTAFESKYRIPSKT